MRTCEYCNTNLEDDDNFCYLCGCNLLLQISHLRLHWTPAVAEANCLHWLAQSQRRMMLPIESTEEIPFVAFEYGWKVVNRLYNSLSIPKILNPKTGKNRESNAKESILFLFGHFKVTQSIIDTNRKLIRSLCDCVLEVSDQTYLGDKRGYITFDDASPEEATELRSAIQQCSELSATIDAGNYDGAAEALVQTLLSVRNARMHAAFPKPKELPKIPVGGNNESIRPPRIERYDHELYAVVEILLSIGKLLISAKTSTSLDDIEELVRSRIGQIANEIHGRVKLWEPSFMAKFTEEKIIGILKENESGANASDLCLKHGIGKATLYTWKAKYGGLAVSEAKRLMVLEDENTKVKMLLADAMLENSTLKDQFLKKIIGPAARRQSVAHRQSSR